MYAAFGSDRSGTMRVTKRLGMTAVSTRVKTTSAPAASAFFDTKRRPKLVAAHSVPASPVERSAATMTPPVRSVPYPSPVRSPARRLGDSGVVFTANGNGTPSGTQSPQIAVAEPPLNRQDASSAAWLPPLLFV